MSASHSPVHLEMEPPRRRAGGLQLVSRLREHGGAELGRLRFELPDEFAPLLGRDPHDLAEAHLLAALLLAMQHDRALHVHGRVSPTLLRGLEEFMACWALWRPRKLRAVRVPAVAAPEPPAPRHPDRAVAAFSGGLDSSYTLWRHTRGWQRSPDRRPAGIPLMRRRRELTHVVLIRGLEKRLQDDAAWQRVLRDQQRTAASAGVTLLPVTFNFVELYPGPRFFNAWGACVVGCLTLFQQQFGAGLVPAGANYGHLLLPQPTSPYTDHLLSSRGFRIVHDGAEQVRTAKSRWLADWPEALAGLRVCGRDPTGGNCGRCEKCVRTILGFRVFGLPLPPAFPLDPDDAGIRAVKVTTPAGAYSSESLLGVAAELGRERDGWARAVSDGVTAYRRRERLKAWRDRWVPRRRATARALEAQA